MLYTGSKQEEDTLNDENGLRLKAPEILSVTPSDLSVKSGEAAMFTVSHTGDTNLKWFRGRKEVEPGNIYQITCQLHILIFFFSFIITTHF